VSDVNTLGPLLGCRYALPLLAKSAAGAIVNVSSNSSITAIPSIPAYTASKAALNAFIQKHVTEMKKLKAEIEAEKTAVPNSLEAAFERLQGKAFVDVEKNDKLAETRKEANAVNSLLRAQGCTPVDIDRALANP